MSRPVQTHCNRGHEFTPENTYYTPKTYAGRSTPNKRCIACHKQWKVDNREQHLTKMRDSNFKLKYGISAAEYDKMVEEQEGKCAICSSVPKKLFVDHNHRTEKVRALLCRLCNAGLGMFLENQTLLQNAVRYLQLHAEKEN